MTSNIQTLPYCPIPTNTNLPLICPKTWRLMSSYKTFSAQKFVILIPDPQTYPPQTRKKLIHKLLSSWFTRTIFIMHLLWNIANWNSLNACAKSFVCNFHKSCIKIVCGHQPCSNQKQKKYCINYLYIQKHLNVFRNQPPNEMLSPSLTSTPPCLNVCFKSNGSNIGSRSSPTFSNNTGVPNYTNHKVIKTLG